MAACARISALPLELTLQMDERGTIRFAYPGCMEDFIRIDELKDYSGDILLVGINYDADTIFSFLWYRRKKPDFPGMALYNFR